MPDTLGAITDKEKLFEGFEYLMPFRVENILLVSSLYDSFILREDGRLNELLIGESLELDLQHVPAITQVCRGAEALERLRSQPQLNLVVANLELGDMDAAQLADAIHREGLDVPVVVLAYDYREVKNFVARHPATAIERVFLWQGNARILIAILKYIEDKRNVAHDTVIMGVPVVLVVEDNIRYYSSFLPVIYTELITQSRRLLREGINLAHKLLRMRARPKILLCSDFEEAAEQAMRYKEYLFGVISDVEFPRGGELTPEAGFELAHLIRRAVPDVPIALQSSRTQFLARASQEGFSFLRKRSPTLLSDLRRLLTQEFALGDFVFRLPNRTEVARATDLSSLEALVREVPAESIAYHSARNHFSHWLRARTEFALAQKLRPRKVSDFPDSEALRRDLLESITEYRREQSQVLIGDFSASSFKASEDFFLRIGTGSLGGKARGLAFVRQLLRQNGFAGRYPGTRIAVPPTLVLTSGIFDEFLSLNGLFDFALRSTDENELRQRFLAAALPSAVRKDLRAFLREVHYPLAVRSSSLLEDSQQPFTGVYETFMVANRNPGPELRLNQLMEAIKRVYASTFSARAKAYVRATPYRLEEEKMAVVVQQVIGENHGTRFYPDFSGVLRSRNFYPVPPMGVGDGIAAVALGLGRTVVEGGRCLMFCPRYPRHPIQFSSVDEVLANSQTEFWALELERAGSPPRAARARGGVEAASDGDPVAGLKEARFGLDVAEKDDTLRWLGSTYSPDAQAVYDGVSRPGVRIVSFAPILKHDLFPLPSILDNLMRVVENGLGRPVEIEFAVRLPRSPGETSEFGFLQMRPLASSGGGEELHIASVDSGRLLCQSSKVLGNGRIGDLYDLVVVDFHRFERGQSREVARSVALLNARLSEEGVPYLLIGVGRWGSNDPWLGIPVAWEEVSGARVIVEAGFRDFHITPSQGSHFFQNLAAFRVGYFTVNPDAADGCMDWAWLGAQPALEEQGCVRHLRFDQPLVVVMNGSKSQGVIFKPGMEPGGKMAGSAVSRRENLRLIS
jgi:CheY-like chemotaxis protein